MNKPTSGGAETTPTKPAADIALRPPTYSGDIYAPSGVLLKQIATAIVTGNKTKAVEEWAAECKRLGFVNPTD